MSLGSEVQEKMLVSPDGTPLPRITGYETEYGIGYSRTQAEDKDSRDIDTIHESVEKVALQMRGQYGEGGERIYVDHTHPEYSTAEDSNFLDTAYRVLAGHMEIKRLYTASAVILGQVIKAGNMSVDFDYDPDRLEITANTTSPNGVSWGSHKNLLTRHGMHAQDYVRALVVHNVSRLVWQGAGAVGEDPVSHKYRFELSEKAPFICDIANHETTNNRPIVNMRNRPLANGLKYRRIHDISSDSNMNPYTIAMGLAASSIVLRACELGTRFDDLYPYRPVQAIKEIARDPSLNRRVPLELSGKYYTGLEMQMALAERAIAAATKADYITEEETAWGAAWITLLDDLRSEPDKCASRVDWVVKRKLIDRELAAKADTDESPMAVAWAKSIDYHRILPMEGSAMRLLRGGKFECSPPAGLIDKGLPLPPTRAALRGRILHAAQGVVRLTRATWDGVSFDNGKTIVSLPEPYDTMNDSAQEFLKLYSPAYPAA